MKIPCSIVQDLLPAYIEGLCSEETAALVEEHLVECESCRGTYHALKEPVETVSQKEVVPIPNPFSKIRRKHLCQLLAAVLCTAALVLAPFAADQIPFVRDFFHPTQGVNFRIAEDESGWQTVPFENGWLVFDSVFYEKEIINYATNDEYMKVRIKDEAGNIIYHSGEDKIDGWLEPGYGIHIEQLDRGVRYRVEVYFKHAGTYRIVFA